MTELSELSEHELNLTNARINLREAVHMVEELLAHKHSLADRTSDVGEIINRCNWAIDYLYRATGVAYD